MKRWQERFLICLVLCFTVAPGAEAQTSNSDLSVPGSRKAASEVNGNRNIIKGFEGFGPYDGPVRKGVDTSSLFGKVMCGYQGWFGAPGDGSVGNGWQHWTKSLGPMEDGNAKVDLWPDVSELSPGERFQTGFTFSNGLPAEVFSSYEKPTVLRHFRWMRDYGIDGVFVQRFAERLQGYHSLRHDNTVLANCREGANLYGRTYAVMYDLSGLSAGHIEEVMNDWRELQNQMDITGDPAYLHHRGKPLIAIWGIGFDDRTGYTLDECRKLIEFFKNDPRSGGCAIMLGVPAHWRDLDHDATDDPELLDILKMADVISPWTVGRYTNPDEAKVYSNELLGPDMVWCRQRGIGYLPVVFPGFSWYNMEGRQFNMAPRLRGHFLWSQFLNARETGSKMVYVAMFDEVDEGTAIFKCVNDVPVGKISKFLGYEGMSSDYYLRIVGTGGKLIRGEISLESAKDVAKLVDEVGPRINLLSTNSVTSAQMDGLKPNNN